MLDKVSELMYNVVTQMRLTQPLTKGKKNANSYKAVRQRLTESVNFPFGSHEPEWRE